MIKINLPKEGTSGISIKTSDGLDIIDEFLKMGIHIQSLELGIEAAQLPSLCFYVHLDDGILVDIDRSILNVETIVNNRDEIKQKPVKTFLENFFDPSRNLRIR